MARYNDGNNNRDWKCGGTKTRQTPRKHPRMTRHKNQRTNKTPADTDLQSEPSYLGTKMQESHSEQEPLNKSVSRENKAKKQFSRKMTFS